MKVVRCKECDKAIEGYNLYHANFLLDQHNLSHRKKIIQQDENVQEEEKEVEQD